MQTHAIDYLFPCGPSPSVYTLSTVPRLFCRDCGELMGRGAHLRNQKRCQPCAITRNRAAAKKRNRLEAKRREWLEHPPYCRWEGYEL